MITVTLNDGTKIEYNSFDEIVDYDKIIELDCSTNKLTLLPDLIGNLINLKKELELKGFKTFTVEL